MTGRWAAALASGLMAAGAAMAMVVLPNQGNVLAGQAGGVGTGVELRACAQLAGGPQPVGDCLKGVFQRALQEGNLHELEDELNNLAQGNGDIANSCHAAAHEAGLRIARNPQAVLTGVTEANYPSHVADGCLRGITHGITDAVSADTSLMPDWQDLVKACESVRLPDSPRETNENVSYGGCVEGIGHLAWNYTGDEGKSAQLCTAFKKTLDRKFCTYSFIMEQFVPRPEWTIRPVPMERTAQQWADTCAALAQYGKDILYGCHSGSGYVHVVAGDLKDRGGEVAEAAVNNPSLAVNLAEETLQDLAQWCRQVAGGGGAGLGSCLDGGVTVWPGNVITDPAFIRTWCTASEGTSEYCSNPQGASPQPPEEEEEEEEE